MSHSLDSPATTAPTTPNESTSDRVPPSRRLPRRQGGLLRRQPLMEIGGFQTQTITEDIHTSMNLHARAYRSCYLNKVLSAGLMPETFDRDLKTRKR